MSANVFAFPGRGKGPQPWTNDELAELYRVVDLLGRAGLSVATDMGMSDEGDPWFVFCRTDNEEVIAHFARIDGIFVAASIAVDETFRGANFRQIVDRMVSSQPLVMPRPAPGSKLFLHPAVMLTAFVATALAHSEKSQALDWLHAVEAQWGHGKAAILDEVKHIKTGWFDTLQTLLKLPLHEDKVAHDSSKEGQTLTLASLIAIALVALQPIVEKVAVISHLVADELSSHSVSASQGGIAHAVQQLIDGVIDVAVGPVADHGGNGGHGASHGAAGDEAPGTHKMTAASPSSDSSGSGDNLKTVVDASHPIAVQKVSLDETMAHAPIPAPEGPADPNVAFLLMQQKVAAMVAQPVAETFTIHVDLSPTSTQPITIQDLTSEAITILNLHITKADSSLKNPSDSNNGASPSVVADAKPASQPELVSSGGDHQADSAPITIDTNVNPDAAIKGISDFVTSGTHAITSQIDLGSALNQKLASYFGGNSSLKVVFFETDHPMADVFGLASDVVFVNEKDLPSSVHLVTHGSNLVLDVTGGTVTLVGVATIEPTPPSV